jgi:hypothetical protein
MLTPDSETRRLLVRERQAQLEREALVASLARPDKVDSRRRRRRLQLRRLWFRLRPAGDLP